MKRLLSIALLAIALVTFAFNRPALAADTAAGATIFNNNCAACHAGGNNVVMSQKTLKKDALEKFGMNSLDAIKTQVKNGKSAMPAFKRFSDEEVENVAAYVLQQSENGWKS